MIIRIVTFRLDGIDQDQYQHHAVSIADTFNRWTGLQAKLWLADQTGGVYGGVYLFDSQQAADQSRSTPKAGLVERLPNPADRRGVLVRATPAGRERFEAVTPKLQAFHATQWANLTHAEVQEFHRLLAKALWGRAGEPARP